MWPRATIIGVEDSEIDCQLQEGMEAEQKWKKKQGFLVPSPKKVQSGPGGPNASGWEARDDGALERAVAARPLEVTRGMRNRGEVYLRGEENSPL